MDVRFGGDAVPVVDAESLQALKALLSAAFDEDVVQDRHPSVDDAGETDVEIVEAIAAGTTEALSSRGKNWILSPDRADRALADTVRLRRSDWRFQNL